MYFDRFDICEAYYVFAVLWHGGQWSPEYRFFGRLESIGFKPSPLLRDEKSLNENGRAIYNGLIERFGKKKSA